MRRRLSRRYVTPFPSFESEADGQYEAALSSSRNINVPILLYLARAWYAYATRESNISGMAKALLYCQQVCPSSHRLLISSRGLKEKEEKKEEKADGQAMHIQPSDRAILYNIAMIQQKSAELLFSLEPSKRTTEELKVAIDHAQQAVKYVFISIPALSLPLHFLSLHTSYLCHIAP
jgi:RNA polymerase-associated protein CTR9